MVRSSHRWPIRFSRRATAAGVLLVLGLSAALARAPRRVRTRAETAWHLLAEWLWPTRWSWPLAAALILLALLTPLAHRRLPKVAHRLAAAFGLFLGFVVLASLATMTWAGAKLLALAIAVAVVAGLVLVIPRWIAPPVPEDELPPTYKRRERLEAIDARTKLRNDARTTILQALAGLAVLAGAVLGFQQLTEDRRQATATQRQAINAQELTRRGQAGERFSRAVAQLSSTSMDVRLGGLYELEQLGHEDKPEQPSRPQRAPPRRLAIFEVVAAFVREHAKAPAITKRADKCPPERRLPQALPPPQDVVAALTILSRWENKPEDPLDLRRVKFGRVNLTNQELSFGGADLSAANLQGAVLDHLDFSNATFVVTNLRNASLKNAVLKGRYTRLHDATLSCADLRGADLRGADLKGVMLRGAMLKGTKLQEAKLRGAKLEGAKLKGAKLKGAIASRTTTWPDGFDWRGAGVRLSTNP
jgi:Pentapeptide repeats (8 copies)